MKTASVQYLGGLRCESTHLQSGQSLVTDAPLDNHGRGEAFSPTDLVATALANCMLTVMGIKARSWQKDLRATTATVTKYMGDGPRRIVAVEVELRIDDIYTDEEREILQKTAHHCPVAKSLHPDLEQRISFEWI